MVAMVVIGPPTPLNPILPTINSPRNDKIFHAIPKVNGMLLNSASKNGNA